MLSFIERIIGFGYRIFLVREIGALGLGLYQISFSIFFLLVSITSSGLPITVSKECAKYIELNSNESANRITTASIVVGTAVSLFIALLFLIGKNLFSYLFTDSRCYSIFLLSLPAFIFSSMYSSLRGGLWGRKKYFAFSFTETIQEFLIVIFGVLLVLTSTDMLIKVQLASFAVSIAYLISTAITLIFYFKLGGRFKNPLGEITPLIKKSTPITSIRICASVVQSLLAIIIPMRLVVGGMSMESALSEYGIVVGMTLPLLFIPSTVIGSLALVLLPEMAKMNLNEDKTLLISKIKKVFNICIFISGIMLPTLLVFSKDITFILFKNSQAGSYLRYAAFLMIPMCISQISSSILNSLELEKKAFKNYLAGSFTLITLSWVLPPILGIHGLIVSYGVSVTITCILNMLSLTKSLNFKSMVHKSIIYVTLITIPSLLLSFFVFNILNTFIPQIISLGISIFLSFATYLSFMYIFNLISKEEILLKQKLLTN